MAELRLANPHEAKRALFPHFAPVQKRLWIESSDPHYTGFATFELSPSGLRWWWDNDEGNAVALSASAIVQSSILEDLAAIEEDMAMAVARLDRVKKRVLAIDRLRSWKLIPSDTDPLPLPAISPGTSRGTDNV